MDDELFALAGGSGGSGENDLDINAYISKMKSRDQSAGGLFD